MLEIRSNVDQNTGNINFTGDVIVNGDVCYGFAVKSGGNVTVKGVVEGASIEAAGSVNVGKGINGASREKITAGGDLRSRYIENAELYVEGDITADYIIDSNITCHGNIELAGKNEVIIGGSVRILGELTARYIGNENERPTRIEVIGVEVVDNEAINRLITEREGYNAEAQKIIESYEQLCSLQNAEDEEEMQDQLDNIRRKLVSLKDRIDYTSKMIENLKKEVTYEYRGSISCKRKLYQGVRIYFGGTVFRFDSDNLEHCRIFCSDGEIINGTL